jgi:hypothetical protein
VRSGRGRIEQLGDGRRGLDARPRGQEHRRDQRADDRDGGGDRRSGHRIDEGVGCARSVSCCGVVRGLALRRDLDGEHARRPASGGCRLARPRRRRCDHRALGDPATVARTPGSGSRRETAAASSSSAAASRPRPACTPSACASNTAAPPTPSAVSATTTGCSQHASSRFASKLRILLRSRRSRQRHEKCQGGSSAPRASPDVSSTRPPPRLAGFWDTGQLPSLLRFGQAQLVAQATRLLLPERAVVREDAYFGAHGIDRT